MMIWKSPITSFLVAIYHLRSGYFVAAGKNKSKGCQRKVTSKTRRRIGKSWFKNQQFLDEKLPVRYSLPSGYSSKKKKSKKKSRPVPLVLFFHGYGGKPNDYNDQLKYFTSNGMMTAALTGMGGNDVSTSWNGFGSASSSSDRPTCNSDDVYCNAEGGKDDYDYYNYNNYDNGDVNLFDDNNNDKKCNCYDDCNGGCADNCWWTTCKDSVQQTKEVLDQVLNNYCIDLDQIWAVGSSNGGMFTHELASDERIAPFLAGIIPMVGLPHFGFNNGPLVVADDGTGTGSSSIEPISYLGLWGTKDTVVPPYETVNQDGTTTKCKSFEEQGWYYTTAECVTEYWGTQLGCDKQIVQFEEPTLNQKTLSCWSYTNCDTMNNNSNSSKSSQGVVEVTGCVANVDHYTYFKFAFQYIVDYIKSHPRRSVSV